MDGMKNPKYKMICFVLGMWGVCSTYSLVLLPGPLSLGMVVPIGVPFMSQIDLFENYSYSIGASEKEKTLEKKLHKKCTHGRIMNAVSHSIGIK